MKKFGHIFVELYSFNVYFIRCSRTVYEKKIKHEFYYTAPHKNSTVKATVEVYYKDDTPVGVLWLSDDAGRAELVHECFHLAHFFLDDIGMKLSDNSEEAYAYLIQWLFAKLEKVLFRGKG